MQRSQFQDSEWEIPSNPSHSFTQDRFLQHATLGYSSNMQITIEFGMASYPLTLLIPIF
jgi:hypothetical protein